MATTVGLAATAFYDEFTTYICYIVLIITGIGTFSTLIWVRIESHNFVRGYWSKHESKRKLSILDHEQ